MPLKPLKLEYYTLKQLSEEFDIPWTYVYHHSKTGKLKKKYLNYDNNDIATPADEQPLGPHLPSQYTVVLWEEAKRFYKQYRDDIKEDIEMEEPRLVPTKETVEELRDRLKSKGKTDKEIALELKEKYPNLSHDSMYKLVLEPSAVRTFTYRHRCRLAEALLK